MTMKQNAELATLSTTQTWQQQLKSVVTEPRSLLQMLSIHDEKWLTAADRAAKLFPLRVPHAFISRMEPGNIADPLLRQVLPLADELDERSGYSTDPLREHNANPTPGLLHKYRNRILLTTTEACAIHCRYCFRRHFDYASNRLGTNDRDKITDYIKQHPAVTEIILSGGDPLSASDQYLKHLVDELLALTQLKTLRIHTRLPIVIPDRINSSLLNWLSSLPVKTVVVVHCNHPQEIDAEVKRAIAQLSHAVQFVLNQSVLLRGINDNANTLIELSETLMAANILPYYLHMPDAVAGTSQFAVSLNQAQTLLAEIQAALAGYLVPRLVSEVAGASSKKVLTLAL